MKIEKYWDKRSEIYNSFKRVTDKKYMNELFKDVKFKKSDVVLDVGCGTGIVSDFISSKVKKVFSIDASQGMVEQNKIIKNKVCFQHDITEQLFNYGTFDKIVARMVFHYVTKHTQKAMDNCYRMLKHGGKFIFSESVPMNDGLRRHYTKIFKHREPRLTYTKDDWIMMLKRSGFKNISVTDYISPLCLEDWVSDTSREKAKKILDLHLNASGMFKVLYNLRKRKDGKHLIDIKKTIIVGEK